MAERIVELAAGTYDIRGDATSQATVPTLTAGSIDQATPNIGDTLTVSGSNVSGGATTAYQWEQSADGSTGWADISGATSASLDTSSGVTDDYYVRRGVADGVQSEVFTAAVQVEAAVATPLVLTQTADDTTQTGDGATTTFNYTLDIDGPGEIFVGVFTFERALSSATINGGSNLVPGGVVSGGAGIIIYAVNDTVASGTTISFSITYGAAPPNGLPIRVVAYRAENFASLEDSFTADDVDFDSGQAAGTFNIADDDGVLVFASEQGGSATVTLIGATADVAAFDIDVSDLCIAGSDDALTADATYDIGASATLGDVSVVALHLR